MRKAGSLLLTNLYKRSCKYSKLFLGSVAPCMWPPKNLGLWLSQGCIHECNSVKVDLNLQRSYIEIYPYVLCAETPFSARDQRTILISGLICYSCSEVNLVQMVWNYLIQSHNKRLLDHCRTFQKLIFKLLIIGFFVLHFCRMSCRRDWPAFVIKFKLNKAAVCVHAFKKSFLWLTLHYKRGLGV